MPSLSREYSGARRRVVREKAEKRADREAIQWSFSATAWSSERRRVGSSSASEIAVLLRFTPGLVSMALVTR